MAFDPLSAIVSVGSNLLGGMMGSNEKEKDRQFQLQQAAKNEALQREFAQNSIRWKVEDAKAAGLHPLAALGTQSAGYSPTIISSGSANPMGDAVRGAGQDLSRALTATRTGSERVDAYTAAIQGLNLERGQLENDLLRSRIARLNSGQVGPAAPQPAGEPYLTDGAGGPGGVKDKPMDVMVNRNNPYAEPGAVADTGWARTASGGWAPIPSKDAKDRLEDITIPQLMWGYRNNILPNLPGNLGANNHPPQSALPPGHKWQWSYKDQAWYPVPTKFRGGGGAGGGW